MTNKPVTHENIEILLPVDTIKAIEDYAQVYGMSFDEATQRFITIGRGLEQFASESGTKIEIRQPKVK